jgi:hypothetical protein
MAAAKSRHASSRFQIVSKPASRLSGRLLADREEGLVPGIARSPLTDSNRRPPPYHRSLEREAKARAGRRDHERPGRTGNRLKRSDRGWTRLPAFVFPQCSLGVVQL